MGKAIQIVKIDDESETHKFFLDEEALSEILNKDNIRDKPICIISVAGTIFAVVYFVSKYLLILTYFQELSGKANHSCWTSCYDIWRFTLLTSTYFIHNMICLCWDLNIECFLEWGQWRLAGSWRQWSWRVSLEVNDPLHNPVNCYKMIIRTFSHIVVLVSFSFKISNILPACYRKNTNFVIVCT